jgi:hypothetical protein
MMKRVVLPADEVARAKRAAELLDHGLMEEAIDEVNAMTPEEVNESIRRRGHDPDELAQRMLRTAGVEPNVNTN